MYAGDPCAQPCIRKNRVGATSVGSTSVNDRVGSTRVNDRVGATRVDNRIEPIRVGTTRVDDRVGMTLVEDCVDMEAPSNKGLRDFSDGEEMLRAA